MANVKVIDRGMNKIIAEVRKANSQVVAVGIMAGATNKEGASIAEYAAYNEYGTQNIPSRPFMAISVDENKQAIAKDFERAAKDIIGGGVSAYVALEKIGAKHQSRIQYTISGRDILPKLSAKTIAKKGGTKTLVDTGAMRSAVTFEVR